MPVAEPVCNATTNVVEDGEEHCYAVNPCGVAVGREAYFRVEVSPAELPDSEIVWVTSEGLDFVGPRAGRAVAVRGVRTGFETLTVQIGGREVGAPEFPVRVVEPATVNLCAWIIESKNKEKAFAEEDVRRMVKDANDIYAQVGVTLNLVEPVVVTNIPDAYDAFFETPTNAMARWSFDRIVGIASDTGGLECYFINRFVDRDGTKAGNSGYGIVMTASATKSILAHEIGHAFGMSDIYITNDGVKDEAASLVTLSGAERAAWSRMNEDWNGGCRGRGFGGSRYYRLGTSIREIVGRMLMLGLVGESDEGRDISCGCVHGVFYEYENGAKVWRKDIAPVAFPWWSRNPTHH